MVASPGDDSGVGEVARRRPEAAMQEKLGGLMGWGDGLGSSWIGEMEATRVSSIDLRSGQGHGSAGEGHR
ncbi:hypothetical protein ZWY2020_032987 [Hordeum vulgare]|nr:hypothetical protein ZWY2020_032987 [Hordeum vulgare]